MKAKRKTLLRELKNKPEEIQIIAAEFLKAAETWETDIKSVLSLLDSDDLGKILKKYLQQRNEFLEEVSRLSSEKVTIIIKSMKL